MLKITVPLHAPGMTTEIAEKVNEIVDYLNSEEYRKVAITDELARLIKALNDS